MTMIPMTHRIDSWSHREDKILLESVLQNAMGHKDKMEAFRSASVNLAKNGFSRTDVACSNRYYKIKDKIIDNPSLEIEEVVKIPDVTAKEEDIIDSIISDRKPREDKILSGIYLDGDISNLLDLLGKKGGRGAKSRIANDALRKLFEEKGLL